MSRKPPPQWQKAMDRVGLSSMRRLGEAVGAHPSTISAMMFGDRATSPDLVERVAEALRVDRVKVSDWIGQARTVEEDWYAPVEAALLTRRQRAAVDEVIRAMAARERGEQHDGTTTILTQEAVLGQIKQWVTGEPRGKLAGEVARLLDERVLMAELLHREGGQDYIKAQAAAIDEISTLRSAKDLYDLASRTTGIKSQGQLQREQQDRDAQS